MNRFSTKYWLQNKPLSVQLWVFLTLFGALAMGLALGYLLLAVFPGWELTARQWRGLLFLFLMLLVLNLFLARRAALRIVAPLEKLSENMDRIKGKNWADPVLQTTREDEIGRVVNKLAQEGKTPLLFLRNGKLLGVIAVADTIRETSRAAIQRFNEMGLHVVMLTGDNKVTAEAIRKELGIEQAISDVLPTQKEAHIRSLQEEGHKVAMVGDGINDAPALTRADIGIAIGAGTDTAIESADVVLMKDSLDDVAAAIDLSRAVVRNIHMNLFWAFFYNVLGIPLAAGVLYPAFQLRLSPMIGSAAMSLSSVCVVTNALRLRFFKSKFRTQAPQSQQTENVPGASAGDDRAPAPVCDQSCPVQLEESNQTTQGGTETMTKTLNIEGMMCAHCVAHVEKALSALGGVTSAKADLEKKQATVTLAAPVSDQELKDAVTEAGYEVVSIQ